MTKSNKKNNKQNVKDVIEQCELGVKLEENFDESCIIKTSTILTEIKQDICNISLIELVHLENACALICKKYEMAARIDRENNDKFKEYKTYYQKIFEELERRVANLCK